MSIELLIQSGANLPARTQRFDDRRITIGRDPSSTLRFDMKSDLEVSTRHAEIQEKNGEYLIADRDSTNGTWVNGGRLRGPRVLNPGDVINLGRRGPELRVVAVNDQVWHQTVESKIGLPPLPEAQPWRQHRTRDWVVHVVETHTRSLKLALVGLTIGVLGAAFVLWLSARGTAADESNLWREVTMPAILKANEDAVVLIESQMAGPVCAKGCEGTGFAITRDGLIVTNRHVVELRGVRARQLRVKFANTGMWYPAAIVKISRDSAADLALIKVATPGEYPAIVGFSSRGADLPVGSSVMTIGFPLGTALQMEGSGPNAIAKTTTTTGSVAKILSSVIQIDASADHGSSGSPVFDRHGHAIGVVSGGSKRPSERIVYVVPAAKILDLQGAAGINPPN